MNQIRIIGHMLVIFKKGFFLRYKSARSLLHEQKKGVYNQKTSKILLNVKKNKKITGPLFFEDAMTEFF